MTDSCLTPVPTLTAGNKKILLIIGILVGFIPTFDISAVNVALPAIMNEHHVDAIMLSWFTTSYLLASAVFLVPIGKLSDIHGRKRFFLYGTAVFTAASFAMTLVPFSMLLITVRVIQGIGAAMIFVTALAIFTSVFTPLERGRALGLTTMAAYLGLTIGPFIGGFFTEILGWRSIFLVNVPLGILACLLILRHLPGEWADCAGEKFDLWGSVMYAVTLVAVMVGFTFVPDPSGFLLICAGCILGGFFLLYETRICKPVLDIRVLTGNRVFLLSNIAALASYAATFAVTFLISLDLQFTKGLSPVQAGIILIIQPACMAALSPVSGRLSDTVDPRIVASAGMALTTFSLFLFTFLGAASPLWYTVICLVLLGIGFGLFSSPNINVIMSSVEEKSLGVASGMNGTMRLIGQTLSMGIAMMLFSILIGPVVITPSQYPQFITSMHASFVIFTLLSLVGTAASCIRGTRKVTKPVSPGG